MLRQLVLTVAILLAALSDCQIGSHVTPEAAAAPAPPPGDNQADVPLLHTAHGTGSGDKFDHGWADCWRQRKQGWQVFTRYREWNQAWQRVSRHTAFAMDPLYQTDWSRHRVVVFHLGEQTRPVQIRLTRAYRRGNTLLICYRQDELPQPRRQTGKMLRVWPYAMAVIPHEPVALRFIRETVPAARQPAAPLGQPSEVHDT